MNTETFTQEQTRQGLKILYLEDSLRDRELAAERLKADGIACEFIHAATRHDKL